MLGDGYRRTGVFRKGGVVQVVYSDGIYDMSVFEQRGRLGSKAAPRGGRPVRVGGSKGWQYTWPGGQVVLWQAGRTVYTVVADAPYDDVLGAIRTVKGTESLLLLTTMGMGTRIPVDQMRSMGRSTQGVTLMDLDESDRVTQVAVLPAEEEPAQAPGSVVAG